MVKRAKRKIGSKTARAMLTWSHYQFKQRLLDKTKEYPWCKIQIVDEDYTSKTCGYCGNIHQKLGSNKTFKCPTCKKEVDRDINGARNILLRFLTLRAGSFDSALGPTPSAQFVLSSAGLV
jgi:putative transposase